MTAQDPWRKVGAAVDGWEARLGRIQRQARLSKKGDATPGRAEILKALSETQPAIEEVVADARLRWPDFRDELLPPSSDPEPSIDLPMHTVVLSFKNWTIPGASAAVIASGRATTFRILGEAVATVKPEWLPERLGDVLDRITPADVDYDRLMTLVGVADFCWSERSQGNDASPPSDLSDLEENATRMLPEVLDSFDANRQALLDLIDPGTDLDRPTNELLWVPPAGPWNRDYVSAAGDVGRAG